MTKVKLVDGTIVHATCVEVVRGVLLITTTDMTVEELASKFSDKSNTNLLVLMTESNNICGYRTGFTSFAGIDFDAAGNKTIKMYQPTDIREQRIVNAEAAANKAIEEADKASLATQSLIKEVTGTIEDLQAQVDYIAIMTEVE